MTVLNARNTLACVEAERGGRGMTSSHSYTGLCLFGIAMIPALAQQYLPIYIAGPLMLFGGYVFGRVYVANTRPV